MGRKQVFQTFVESAFSAPREIDREQHVIRGVKVLGSESKNGRHYSEAAMMRGVGLYEGANVNIDHPDQPAKNRGVMESVGVLKSARYEKGGIFADFHILSSHPHAAVVMERAEKFPNNFGLSHNAEGKATRKDGKLIVESIERVRSVDLVTNPATVRGLFESEETVEQITLKEFATQTNNALLLKLAEDGEMGAMPMDAPAADMSSDDQIKSAFRSAVMAAFDDESLDSKATLAKIKEVLKAYDKLKEGGEKKEEPEAPAEDKATEAIRTELADLRKLLMEQAIDTLKRTVGLKEDKLTEAQRTKLTACKSVDEAKALVESLPAVCKGASVPFTPGAKNPKPEPAGYKRGKAEFLESIGRG